jgi:peptide/nickel transport system permease protein
MFELPSSKYLLGTDEFGRDILSRLIFGARVSLQVGFIAVGISLVVGGLLGAFAGFYGGWLDNLIMRVMDVLLSVPQTLLAIAIAAALGPGLYNLMIAVGISAVPNYARIVRGSVLSIRGMEYVEAARAVGSSDLRIILRHIIPNSMAPIIVQSTLGVASAILNAAGLSFIGLGIQPPNPEWGAMLSGGRQYIRDFPHLTLYPGLAIMLTILALNFLGDGLRDALDPKLKR